MATKVWLDGANFRRIIVFTVVLSLGTAVCRAQPIGFSFRATLAGDTSDPFEFGLRDDARQGLDSYDVPEPPVPPNALFDSYLAMFDAPAALPNRWRRDYRPTVSLLSDRVELWQYEFHTDSSGGEITIDIDSLGPIPVPYELYVFGPGVYYEPIAVPASIILPLAAKDVVFFWELRLADAVGNQTTTWEDIKILFR